MVCKGISPACQWTPPEIPNKDVNNNKKPPSSPSPPSDATNGNANANDNGSRHINDGDGEHDKDPNGTPHHLFSPLTIPLTHIRTYTHPSNYNINQIGDGRRSSNWYSPIALWWARNLNMNTDDARVHHMHANQCHYHSLLTLPLHQLPQPSSFNNITKKDPSSPSSTSSTSSTSSSTFNLIMWSYPVMHRLQHLKTLMMSMSSCHSMLTSVLSSSSLSLSSSRLSSSSDDTNAHDTIDTHPSHKYNITSGTTASLVVSSRGGGGGDSWLLDDHEGLTQPLSLLTSLATNARHRVDIKCHRLIDNARRWSFRLKRSHIHSHTHFIHSQHLL
jgi:hypothetical protein